VPRPSSGPIYAEACQASATVTSITVLTTSAVAAVSVAGGSPIPTKKYPTLLDGLRAVVVELRGHAGQPQPGIALPCPKVTPLDARLRPLSRHGKPNKPLAVILPGKTGWLGKLDSGRRTCPISGPLLASCVPAPHPPAGACHLTATNPGPGITEQGGSIATRIEPVVGLSGTTFLSCVDYEYFYEEEHRLDSAVLLNEQHPGAEPPPLPAQKPLAGHPGIFTTPGIEGQRIARRIPSAWLVVEESDQIGLTIPLALLEALSAEINLKHGTAAITSALSRRPGVGTGGRDGHEMAGTACKINPPGFQRLPRLSRRFPSRCAPGVRQAARLVPAGPRAMPAE
jgi:hypothetical protein